MTELMKKKTYINRTVSALIAAALIFTDMPRLSYAAEAVSADSISTQQSADISIGTIEDFEEFALKAKDSSYTAGKVIRLTGNLDLTGREFTPIPVMAGCFDGNGHVIKGVQLKGKLSETGFIRNVTKTGIVTGLTIEGSISASGTAENIGGIVGENDGLITKCTFTGSIDAEKAIGGIVGNNKEDGTVLDCENDGSINAKNQTGGIAGYNEGTIDSCKNTGSINAVPSDLGDKDSDGTEDEKNDERNALELINTNPTDIVDGKIKDSIDVKTVKYTGGIAGASSGTVRNCSNRGVVGYEHIGYITGGVVGYNRGILYSCRNDGTIFGRRDIGGIVGEFEPYVANIYEKDSIDKAGDELDDMVDIIDGLNDTFKDADDSAQARIDDIRGTVDDLRGTVSGYKTYYRGRNDVTEAEIRGYVDALRNETDELEMKSVNAENALPKIKADVDNIRKMIENAEKYAAAGVAVDMRQYTAALRASVRELLSDAGHQYESTSDTVGKTLDNIDDFGDELKDVRTAAENLDDYLRSAYDSYKGDIRATDDDITSKTDTIAAEMDALSDSLKTSDSRIRSKFDEMQSKLESLNNTIHDGFDELDDELASIINADNIGDMFEERSDSKDASPAKGTLAECVNNGYINADVNGGGIAGLSGVEMDIQSEFEVVSGGDVSLKYQRTKKATIINSKNYGAVDVRNSYAGGIVGKMNIGAAVACENYGQVVTTDGDYTGGIAGFAKYVIRDCYNLSTLSGNDYLGGIAGCGSKLYSNYSMSYLEEGGERHGAIAGKLDDDDAAEASGNYYVDYGIGAINGLTLDNEASLISYSDLLSRDETPDDFSTMKITFIADGRIVKIIRLPYGGSVKESELPSLPSKGSRYGFWEQQDLSDVKQNIVVEAKYATMTTTIASDEPFPTILISGNFYYGTNVRYEKTDASSMKAPKGYKAVDRYVYSVSGDYGIPDNRMKVHLLADDYKDYDSVAVMKDGELSKIETVRDGRYMVFDTGSEQTFYVIREKNPYLKQIVAGSIVGILVLIAALIKILGRKR